MNELFFKTVKWYPFSNIVANVPLTIVQLVQVFGVEVGSYTLGIAVSWSRLFGLFNTIIFAYNENIKNIFKTRPLLETYNVKEGSSLGQI
jgi:hypothetical protein